MGIAHIPEISLSCIELCQSCQEHILPFQEVNRNCFHTQALTGFNKTKCMNICFLCDWEVGRFEDSYVTVFLMTTTLSANANLYLMISF